MEIASSHPDEACMAALAAFYRRTPEERRMDYGRDPLFDEVSNNAAANMTFMVEGDCETIAEKAYLIPASEGSDASPSGVCLVTGRNGLAGADKHWFDHTRMFAQYRSGRLSGKVGL